MCLSVACTTWPTQRRTQYVKEARVTFFFCVGLRMAAYASLTLPVPDVIVATGVRSTSLGLLSECGCMSASIQTLPAAEPCATPPVSPLTALLRHPSAMAHKLVGLVVSVSRGLASCASATGCRAQAQLLACNPRHPIVSNVARICLSLRCSRFPDEHQQATTIWHENGIGLPTFRSHSSRRPSTQTMRLSTKRPTHEGRRLYAVVSDLLDTHRPMDFDRRFAKCVCVRINGILELRLPASACDLVVPALV